jgi:hypothetical protein
MFFVCFIDKLNKKLDLSDIKSTIIGLFNEEVDTFSKLSQLPFPTNWSSNFKVFFTQLFHANFKV